MTKCYYLFDNDNPIGTVVKIVTEEDYQKGFVVSYDLPNDVYDFMEDIALELMEAIYIVKDIDKIRKTFYEQGWEEIRLI